MTALIEYGRSNSPTAFSVEYSTTIYVYSKLYCFHYIISLYYCTILLFLLYCFLTDLKPDTRYFYHVGSKRGWSNLFWFKSLPDGTDWTPRLAVFGDLGNINGISIGPLQVIHRRQTGCIGTCEWNRGKVPKPRRMWVKVSFYLHLYRLLLLRLTVTNILCQFHVDLRNVAICYTFCLFTSCTSTIVDDLLSFAKEEEF